ncbi:MAG: hypothetical protein II747_02845 [Clostridia bacterium]|nr:hypothetical protein [Clostridia bacterium]
MKKIISTMLCAALLTAAIFTIGCTDKDKENETKTEPLNTTETSSTDNNTGADTTEGTTEGTGAQETENGNTEATEAVETDDVEETTEGDEIGEFGDD